MPTTKKKTPARLLAYHGDPAIKRKYLARMRAHRKADELCQGVGFEHNGQTRGCAVGCTFDKYDHARGPIEIGVPEVLLHLEDAIFEGLSEDEALDWPEKFLAAIKPGADLSRMHHQFFVWLLVDSKLLMITDSNRAAIEQVAALHERAAAGEVITESDWSAAESAAWSAARWAESAAVSAAVWAAWAARSAARSAAWSARSARSAARIDSWTLMAAKLIELLAAVQPTKKARRA